MVCALFMGALGGVALGLRLTVLSAQTWKQAQGTRWLRGCGMGEGCTNKLGDVGARELPRWGNSRAGPGWERGAWICGGSGRQALVVTLTGIYTNTTRNKWHGDSMSPVAVVCARGRCG